MLAHLSTATLSGSRAAFLCLSLICRHRSSEHISVRVPSCPEHRQEGSLPVSSIHKLQSLEPSVSCVRAKGNINPSYSTPKAITAVLSTRHWCISSLSVHRNHVDSCQNANSGSGGLGWELRFCASDKYPGQRPQRITQSQSRESFKDGSMPRP